MNIFISKVAHLNRLCLVLHCVVWSVPEQNWLGADSLSVDC